MLLPPLLAHEGQVPGTTHAVPAQEPKEHEQDGHNSVVGLALAIDEQAALGPVQSEGRLARWTRTVEVVGLRETAATGSALMLSLAIHR